MRVHGSRTNRLFLGVIGALVLVAAQRSSVVAQSEKSPRQGVVPLYAPDWEGALTPRPPNQHARALQQVPISYVSWTNVTNGGPYGYPGIDLIPIDIIPVLSYVEIEGELYKRYRLYPVIKNNGSQPSGPFKISSGIYLEPNGLDGRVIYLGKLDYPSIPPGVTVQDLYYEYTALEPFRIDIMVDVDGQVNEDSEGNNYYSKHISSIAIRGVPSDFWADQELGKRKFGEISPREVVPDKVSSPGGVIVDRSVSPGRAYVWDSGNSRILGIDLAKCYGQTSRCTPDIVLGQSSASDHGACNQDASYETYPDRVPAWATTLCGVPEWTQTTLEDKSFANMWVDDSGNLYVPDVRNNRVLKYESPFTTDTVADDVWGQEGFSGNRCNFEGIETAPTPTYSPSGVTPLCFRSIGGYDAGVAFDAAGNMWIADGGNHRVLRFPKDASNGRVSHTADLVLGQPDFTSGGDWSFGDALDRMKGPAAVRFDGQGRLYVADSGNNRVLVFDPPFNPGAPDRPADAVLTEVNNPLGLEVDPRVDGLWVNYTDGWDGVHRRFNLATPGVDEPEVRTSNRGGGSIGIDTEGRVLVSAYVYGQDVYRFTEQPDGTFIQDKALFSPPAGYNLTTDRRLEHPGWVGVAVAANQLFVSDGRLLFWNDPLNTTDGQPADGYLGAPRVTSLPNPQFGQLKADDQNRIWATKQNEIHVYQAPAAREDSPIQVLTSSIPVLGGGEIAFSDVQGIAPTSDGGFLWVSEPTKHRVYRIRGPLSGSPIIDVILGQTDVSGESCNRGLVPPPNTDPSRPPSEDAALDMLCYPGALSLDRGGNLFVSDHYLEAQGNWRLLMFSASLFPDSPASAVFAPSATKEFPRASSAYPSPGYSAMTFEPAFNSFNRMVVGYNPYGGPRFVAYYDDPLDMNPANPRDPVFAQRSGQLNDFYGWPVAATFDSSDNLFVLDANRGRVMIYKTPFSNTLDVKPGATVSIAVIVPAEQAEARFQTNWPGSDVVMTLITPSGRVIGRESMAPDVTHSLGATFEQYVVTQPESGGWTVSLFGADVPPEGEPVEFSFTSTPEQQPDSTPPVITPDVQGTLGANGWHVSDVTVTFDVSDPESGVASSSGCDLVTLTQETAGQTLTCTATNGSGLTAEASVTVKIDKTGPLAALVVVAGNPGQNGWYVSDVTVGTSGSDPISAPVQCTADQYLTDETTGIIFSGSCTNDAGLTTQAAPLSVKLDKTPPVVTIVEPAAPTYTRDSVFTVAFDAQDAISGVEIASATLDGEPVTNGQAIDAESLAIGPHELVVTAIDRAGLKTAETCVFRVLDAGVGTLQGVVYVKDGEWDYLPLDSDAATDGHDRQAMAATDLLVPLVPLSGASVTIAGRSGVSNTSGSYTVTNIPAGRYSATCYHQDYGTLRGTVTIADGGTTSRNWVYTRSRYPYR